MEDEILQLLEPIGVEATDLSSVHCNSNTVNIFLVDVAEYKNSLMRINFP